VHYVGVAAYKHETSSAPAAAAVQLLLARLTFNSKQVLMLPALLAACYAAGCLTVTPAMSCTVWCQHGLAATPMTRRWLQHCGRRARGWLGYLHSHWWPHSAWLPDVLEAGLRLSCAGVL
jgi:hypothetical protein